MCGASLAADVSADKERNRSKERKPPTQDGQTEKPDVSLNVAECTKPFEDYYFAKRGVMALLLQYGPLEA